MRHKYPDHCRSISNHNNSSLQIKKENNECWREKKMNPATTTNDTHTAIQTGSTTGEMFPYLEMGTGFFIGLSIGYVLKKSFKIMLFLTGISLILLFVLESQGVIQLDETHLQEGVSHTLGLFKHFALFLKERVEQLHISSGVSAIAGFMLGLKIG